MIEALGNKIIKLENLIFDLDGTLVDTDVANFLAYKEAIQVVKKMDLTLLHRGNNRFTRQKLGSIFQNLSTSEYERIVRIKNNTYHKFLPETKVIISVSDIIHKYAQTHRLILATNSHKHKAELILDYHELSTTFDHKFYKEDYGNTINKYDHVLKMLNIRPEDVFIFEDDKEEIKQAKLAGVSKTNIFSQKTKWRLSCV